MSSKFRTSFTHREGFDPALVCEAKIVNVNTVNWTVDCITLFDRKRYFDIQVASPYLHFTNGEGIYAVPEIGAKCKICIPGDSSAPFVMGFIAPLEVPGSSGTDASASDTGGATGSSKAPNSSTFAAGRTASKPGDMVLKGRDGNFVVLHRGGVVQIGATSVAQRLYIPIANLIEDISGRYAHHNTGGSVLWGMRESDSDTNPPTEHLQAFRVYANEKFADLRICRGKVFNPVGGDDDTGVGDSTELIVEVCLSPKGFDVGTGEANPGAKSGTVYRYLLDRKGNLSLRIEGDGFYNYKKDLNITVVKKLSVKAANVDMVATGNIHMAAPTIDIDGQMVVLAKGVQPVARMGDPVTVAPAAIPISGSMTLPTGLTTFTAVMSITTPLMGIITSGNPRCLA